MQLYIILSVFSSLGLRHVPVKITKNKVMLAGLTCYLILRKHGGVSDFKNGLKTVVCETLWTKSEISRSPFKLKV